MATSNRFSQEHIDLLRVQNHHELFLRREARARELLDRDTPTAAIVDDRLQQAYRDIAATPRPRTWISDIATSVYRNNVLRQIRIDFDPSTLCYRASLNGHHVEYLADTGAPDTVIRQMLTERLINMNMERDAMPHPTDYNLETAVGNDPITATSLDALLGANRRELPTEAPSANIEVPQFVVNQNTQSADLRALREEYPHRMFAYNYQASYIGALDTQRRDVRSTCREAHRTRAVIHVMKEAPPRFRAELDSLLRQNFSRHEWRHILTGDFEGTSAYQYAREMITSYRDHKNSFIESRATFAPLQAQHNQRAAMIRQRPSVPVIVDTGEIISTVSQWEKVWGISIKRDTDGGLQIRIGLCGIVMEESAEESRYDNPMDINLAPFYFTLRLREDGGFQARSSNSNVFGLSGLGVSAGTYDYDIHPHQLSDSPCFGTFGQTLVDLASRGDIIPLIATVIAFYSQYNSQDSAGVNARLFHPAKIRPIEDVASYKAALWRNLVGWHYHIADENKLDLAITDYCAYHTTERENSPPERESRHICYNCEENEVNDDDDFCSTHGGDRVCIPCWENSYCPDCERHNEDCICDDSDY